MAMFEEKTTIGVALESTMGTEVAGATAIRVFNLQMNPQPEFEDRAGTGLYLGHDNTGIHGPEIGKCSFTADLRGTGSAGMEAGLAALLQACFLVKSSETYTVNSTWTNMKTVSIDVNYDGRLETLYGAAGNVKIHGEEGKRVLLDFEFTGLYKIPADTALAAYVPSTQTPMKMSNGYFKINNVAQYCSRFEIDLQNEVYPMYDASATQGILHFYVGNNSPQITCDPLDAVVATYGYDALRRARTTHAVEFSTNNGSDSVTITMPAVQIVEAPVAAHNKLYRRNYVGRCLHSSGNDALSIAVSS